MIYKLILDGYISDLMGATCIRKSHDHNYEIWGTKYVVELKHYFSGENKTK